jgi:hypothetical protein
MTPKGGPGPGRALGCWSLHLMGEWAGGKRAPCACPLVTIFGIRPVGSLLWGHCAAACKEVEDWNPGQNGHASAHRTLQIIGESVVKQGRSNQDK